MFTWFKKKRGWQIDVSKYTCIFKVFFNFACVFFNVYLNVFFSKFKKFPLPPPPIHCSQSLASVVTALMNTTWPLRPVIDSRSRVQWTGCCGWAISVLQWHWNDGPRSSATRNPLYCVFWCILLVCEYSSMQYTCYFFHVFFLRACVSAIWVP